MIVRKPKLHCSASAQWEYVLKLCVTKLPSTNIVIFRFCAVADELNDRIYTIGGADIAKRRSCRYYSVSTNTWDLCEDKNLQADTYVS